jgi:hypothetical protein
MVYRGITTRAQQAYNTPSCVVASDDAAIASESLWAEGWFFHSSADMLNIYTYVARLRRPVHSDVRTYEKN